MHYHTLLGRTGNANSMLGTCNYANSEASEPYRQRTQHAITIISIIAIFIVIMIIIIIVIMIKSFYYYYKGRNSKLIITII